MLVAACPSQMLLLQGAARRPSNVALPGPKPIATTSQPSVWCHAFMPLQWALEFSTRNGLHKPSWRRVSRTVHLHVHMHLVGRAPTCSQEEPVGVHLWNMLEARCTFLTWNLPVAPAQLSRGKSDRRLVHQSACFARTNTAYRYSMPRLTFRGNLVHSKALTRDLHSRPSSTTRNSTASSGKYPASCHAFIVAPSYGP